MPYDYMCLYMFEIQKIQRVPNILFRDKLFVSPERKTV